MSGSRGMSVRSSVNTRPKLSHLQLLRNLDGKGAAGSLKSFDFRKALRRGCVAASLRSHDSIDDRHSHTGQVPLPD